MLCTCCFALIVVCLILLASFFLPSHLSLNMHIITWMYMSVIASCMQLDVCRRIYNSRQTNESISEKDYVEVHLYTMYTDIVSYYVHVHVHVYTVHCICIYIVLYHLTQQLIHTHTHACTCTTVLLCLVCLFDLASFFLPSHLSLKHVYTPMHIHRLVTISTSWPTSWPSIRKS